MWSSRTRSAVDGNPSTTSNVESGYATSSTAPALGDSVEGIDSVDMTGRESSVVAGEPELQSPRETETTVDAGRGKTVRVTLEEPQIGKRRLTSSCWQFVSRFSPSINDRNVLCLVKRSNGKTCDNLIKWTPSDGSKKGTGTFGLIKHLEVADPAMVNKILSLIHI